MQPFITLSGIAAPLPIVNIDTDMIIPKQFLKTIKRSGLGKNLFDEMRFSPDGAEIADFVLNRDAYRKAEILVAGDNFGCGSSREHAPWALLDFGIRCIIAPSFADIFYNNCFNNGILPVALPKAQVDELSALATNDPKAPFSVDLQVQVIRAGNKEYRFDIDAARKERLLKGLDAIGMSLEHVPAISGYEQRTKAKTPWLFG
jgi:3-isopropylmalate/(R)-2-methylmalate dehydratase small subunit